MAALERRYRRLVEFSTSGIKPEHQSIGTPGLTQPGQSRSAEMASRDDHAKEGLGYGWRSYSKLVVLPSESEHKTYRSRKINGLAPGEVVLYRVLWGPASRPAVFRSSSGVPRCSQVRGRPTWRGGSTVVPQKESGEVQTDH